MGVAGPGRIPLDTVVMLMVLLSSAQAAPTLQTYLDGAISRNTVADWTPRTTNNSAFHLILAGAHAGNAISLQLGALIASDASSRTQNSPWGDVLSETIGVDPLTCTLGDDGSLSRSPILDLNSHIPYPNDTADFIYYDLGDFTDVETVGNHDAQTDTITQENAGEEKAFAVSSTDFDWARLDLGDCVEEELADDSRETNLASHDPTYLDNGLLPIVPGPGSFLIAALGITLIGWVRIRKSL